jgi:hypothetical protein
MTHRLFLEGAVCLDDRVENGQELSHRRRDYDVERLSGSAEPFDERYILPSARPRYQE